MIAWRALWGVLSVAMVPLGAQAQSIVSAEFGGETTRYGHAILGDAVEFGSLTVTSKTEMGATLSQRVVLPKSRVFEDLAPRLWDVTGDQSPEVVVVETDVSTGAALAIYGPRGKLAQTPHIGQSNRWLAPIGAADLDGDGSIEIAYIDRPHLAKTLRVWRYKDGELHEVGALAGLTTHQIGQDFFQGAVLECGGVPTIISANANWTRKMGTVLAAGRLSARDLGPYTGPASLETC